MIKTALKEITRDKSRFFNSVTAYSLCISIFILTISLYTTQKLNSDNILSGTGTHFIAFRPLCEDQSCRVQHNYDKDKGFVIQNANTALLKEKSAQIISDFPSVKAASPLILFQLHNSDTKKDINLAGFYPNDKISLKSNCCSASDIIKIFFIRFTISTLWRIGCRFNTLY